MNDYKAQLRTHHDSSGLHYERSHALSITDPIGYWAEQARQVAWYRAPRQILEALPDGTHRWFADGQLNTSYLALDRQIELGRGEQTALIYDSPVTHSKQRYSYNQLRDEVARLAGLLRQLGVKKGDGVIIYMPMVPQAAMAMLACARLGAVHSVVFGGFAPHELAVRIDDLKPKLLLTASCGLEFDRIIAYKPLVDKALELARHQPDHVLVLQRSQFKAATWTGCPRCKVSRRLSRCRWTAVIRFTSCTPQALPGNPKASCAITAGMRWR